MVHLNVPGTVPVIPFRWLLRLPLFLSFATLGVAMLYLATRRLEGICTSKPCEEVQWLFDMNGEGNLPVWFTVVCWLVAGGLAYVLSCSRDEGRLRIGWRALMFLCLYASFDEMTAFHETFGSALGVASGYADLLFYSWLIYGVLAATVVSLLFIPFLLRLPAPTRWNLVLAGGVFLAGAIGVEFLGAASGAGAIDLVQGTGWTIAIMIEETLEILGVVLLVRAIVLHPGNHDSAGRVRAQA